VPFLNFVLRHENETNTALGADLGERGARELESLLAGGQPSNVSTSTIMHRS
jgi:hypothetical protein